jgi:branched-chain amino acid transport system substrate-binding protein
LVATAALGGALALSGCAPTSTGGDSSSSGDAATSSEPESDIPFNALNISDFSAAQMQANNACKAGYDAAAIVLNEKGGILGHKVVWKYVDTAGNVTQATALASREIDTPPEGGGTWNYIQSGGTSDEQLAELPAATKAKIIGLGVQSAAPLADPTTFPYHFMIGVNYTDSAQVQTAWLKEQGFENIGFLYLNTAVGLDSKDIYEKAMDEAGLSYVSVQYPFGQTDVSPQLQRLRSDGVDVVLFGSQQGPTVGYVLDSRNKLGFDVPFLGDVTVSGTDTESLVGPEGIKGLSLVLQTIDAYKDPSTYTDAEKDFYAALEQTGVTVEVPIHVYAACYDELITVNIAAEQAGSLDPDALKEALENLTIPSPSPLVTSPDGFGWTADSHFPGNPEGFYTIVKAGPIENGLLTPAD